MKVKLLAIIEGQAGKSIVLKWIEATGEFPEKPLIEGREYIIHFEEVEPDLIPEFNT